MASATTDFAGAQRISELCSLYLRQPDSRSRAGNVETWNFTPPLTAPEEAIFTRIANLAKSLVPGITVAEWQALEPDIDGLITYQGLASPTLAQTVQAVKAQSRILRAIIKN